MFRLRRWTSLGAALLGAIFLFPPAISALSTSAQGRAVASENETASRDGLWALRQGGSAVDAAVVTALVGGITAPSSSGIGGGGFALVWDAQAKKSFLLDFRETAPLGVDPAALERRPLGPSEAGHLVGVPGELRGLYLLHQRYGRLPWKKLVERAADRAELGYSTSPHLAQTLASQGERLTKVPGFSELYFPDGKPSPLGRTLTRPALGRTLRRVASLGPDAFYGGEVAAEMVDVVAAAKGALSLKDLADYRPIEREPLLFKYEGREILTMPLPSAGGLVVAETLALFSPDYLRQLGRGSPAYLHLLAEAFRGAIADRMRYLSDPSSSLKSLDSLLSESRLARRRSRISLERTHALPRFGLEEHGTHHLVTRDAQGNVVSLTTTINRSFGAKLHCPKSGVILNDELDDFTAARAVAPFGLLVSPNGARPKNRPLSSMSPTLVVEGGQVIAALGGSGGPAIGTNVTQVLLDLLVFGQKPNDAVKAPRIYIPTEGASLWVETGTSAEVKADLERRGEVVGDVPFNGTAVQALVVGPEGIAAASDPRKQGAAFVE